MRRTKLAVVISSVLLGAVAAHAEPATDPAQNPPASTTEPAGTQQSSGTATSQDADTSPGANNNDSVGAADSNVDEKSSSGSYYPYSAGTVGDDPSEPKSTSPQANTGENGAGPTDQWIRGDADGDGYLSKDELAKISPTLVKNFDSMDVDSNGKLTRGEFRTWHESHKAKMDADQPAAARSATPSATGGNWSSTASNTSSNTSSRTTAPTPTTAPANTSDSSSVNSQSSTPEQGSTTAPDDQGN